MLASRIGARGNTDTLSAIRQNIGAAMLKFFLPLMLLATAAAADYSSHPNAPALLDRLQNEYSFGPEDLDGVRAALTDAQRVPKLIESEQQAKEKTLTWPAYQAIFINTDRIRRGLEFLQTYREPLARAESEFGVPPEVV